jgi:hypothetical protein
MAAVSCGRDRRFGDFDSIARGCGNHWQITRLAPSSRKRAFTRWMNRDLRNRNG